MEHFKLRHWSVLSTAIVASVVIIVLTLTAEPVSSTPTINGGGSGWTEYHRRFGIPTDPKRIANYECDNASREVRELCQRCAKVTKSKLAYPMCCENRENARDWCRELLMIG